MAFFGITSRGKLDSISIKPKHLSFIEIHTMLYLVGLTLDGIILKPPYRKYIEKPNERKIFSVVGMPVFLIFGPSKPIGRDGSPNRPTPAANPPLSPPPRWLATKFQE